MSRISYNKLALKFSNKVKAIDINGNQVEILQYLPISDKNDLIYAVLDKSNYNGVYNEVLLDMYFSLYIVYLYTNITFTDKQKEDEFKLYDMLETNGIIDKIVSEIPTAEYEYLYDMLNTSKAYNSKYNLSAASILNKIITDMPKNAASAAKIVEDFDPEKYKNVLNFAKKAGYRTN